MSISVTRRPAQPAPSASTSQPQADASRANADASSPIMKDAGSSATSSTANKPPLAHHAAAQSQTTTFTSAKQSRSAGTSAAAEKEASKHAPLGPGSTGRRVTLLQLFLVKKGLMTKEQFQAKPGIYGESTSEAVRKFQSARHLDPNGVVGPATREAILKEMDDTTSRDSSLEATSRPPAYSRLR